MCLLIKNLWSLLFYKEKVIIFILILLLIFNAVLELLGIALVMPVIAILSNPEILEQNYYLQMIKTIFGNLDNLTLLSFICWSLILIYTVKNVYMFFLNYYQNRFICRMTARLATQLFNKYLHAPYALYLQKNSNELLNNIVLIRNFAYGIFAPLMIIITDIIVIITIFCALLFISPFVTLFLSLLSLLVVIVLMFGTRSLNYRYGEKMRIGSEKIVKITSQSLEGIKDCKIRNAENFFIGEHDKYQKKYQQAFANNLTLGNFPRFFIEWFLIVIGFMTILILINFEKANSSILLNLSIFAMSVIRIMPSLSRLQYNIASVIQNQSLFNSIFEDLSHSEWTPLKNTGSPICFEHQIQFDHLSFKYPETDSYIFKNFNLKIVKNSATALVGTTGCGKTTLIDILLGFHHPSDGHVWVDDRDIYENLSSWQTQIGYIPQLIHLNDDSIRSNIAYATPVNQISDEQVWKCLEIAQLKEFVESLPEQLDTQIGERGIRLSGGQRQRIGIARALYHNPCLLILDEATSALDNETEKAFVDAIRILHGKLTIIMIAHRLSSTVYCDNIVHLDQLIAESAKD